MRAAAEILGPLLIAVFFAILIHPTLEWLRSKKLASWLTFLLVFLGVAVVGIVFLLFFSLSLGQLQDNLPVYERRLAELTNSITGMLDQQGIDVSNIENISALNPERLAGTAAGFITLLFGQLSVAFLVLLLLLFLLSEAQVFASKVEKAFGANNPAVNKLATFSLSIKAYSKIRTISNLFVGISFLILLLVLGVDLALLWGLLAFLLSYIPTIGLVLAAIPAIILALLEQGFTTALIVTIGVIIINGISDSVIAPRLSAQELELSPFAVFFSFIFWGWVFGPVGAVLSVILTLGIKLLLDAYPETRPYSVILGLADIGKTKTDG